MLSTPFDLDKGLTLAETRAHFGSWAIVSSPLTLSHDPNNQTVMDAIWPLISNREVLEVSQSYVDHSGSPFKQSEQTVRLATVNSAKISKHMTKEELQSVGPFDAPTWQYFYKPIKADGAKTAVLLMNHGNKTADLTLDFADVPGLKCSSCNVRDIWNHQDLGSFDTSVVAKTVASHDAAFYVITPA